MTELDEKAAGGDQAADSIENLNLNSTVYPNFQEAVSSSLAWEEFEAACKDRMARDEVPLNGTLYDDGRIRRYSKHGKRRDKDEGYVCYRNISHDARPYWVCTYWTWSGGYKKFPPFSSFEIDTQFTEQEKQQLHWNVKQRQKEFEEQLEKEREEKTKRAKATWDKASLKPETSDQTEYLERKQIGAYGIRFARHIEFWETDEEDPDEKTICTKCDAIVIPAQNSKGEVKAVQFIRGDGKKRFCGSYTGYFHTIGQITEKSRIIVAEGYATAVSVHEAMGDPVVVALTCGNLIAVIGELRKKYPKHDIFIAPDNDLKTKHDNGTNPGREHAEKAAKLHRCKLLPLPSFPDGGILSDEVLQNIDYNDIRVCFGLDALKAQMADPWYKTRPIPFREAPQKFNTAPFPEEFRRTIEEVHRFVKSPMNLS